MGYFRSPKTQRERREHADPEQQPYARPGRKEIPVYWDDIYPAARKDRNWKRFRKTRYRLALAREEEP